MTEPNGANLTKSDTSPIERITGIVNATPRGKRQWILWGGVVTIVIVGSLWHGTARSSRPTITATLADCSQSIVNSQSGVRSTDLRPIVVGLGTVASMAAIATPTGPVWCFDGMGTGTGGINHTAIRSALDTPVAVVDGSLTSDVLMLVHLGRQTTSVVVTTAQSRSIVLAQGGGFEVLRVPMSTWPRWRAPWTRGPVSLGRTIGFDRVGLVTSSEAFTWCPGSINRFPGTSC